MHYISHHRLVGNEKANILANRDRVLYTISLDNHWPLTLVFQSVKEQAEKLVRNVTSTVI